jgi:hypothetical protein
MVTFYYQYSQQTSEDSWHIVTRHIECECPQVEMLLKGSNRIIDASSKPTPEILEPRDE